MDVPDDVVPLLNEDEKVQRSMKQRKYRPAKNIESATITILANISFLTKFDCLVVQ